MVDKLKVDVVVMKQSHIEVVNKDPKYQVILSTQKTTPITATLTLKGDSEELFQRFPFGETLTLILKTEQTTLDLEEGKQ